ncbi:DoxX family protein [Halegenticoccus tardaugens]|uniref:DoxX family protein n=1 Tax=Halegenticoccus tardaugens TaxID=2071624 RepID=UPI00100B7CF8|nr:DoxX family protein [Halegenticoccus tardaugens]
MSETDGAVEIEVDGTDDDGSDAPPSLLGRLLFAGVLAYSGFDNLRDVEASVGYAEAKGVPFAEILVPASSGMLVLGSVGVALWRLPTLAAGAIASFLVGVTPVMHDFWNQEGEAKQREQINFLKNVGLLGAALSFLARARR